MNWSVIIPTLNGESKLPQILKALQQQSFRDFEVIVVVDGSQDNSIDYLSRFGQSTTLQKFSFVEQENRGRAAARNSGAQNSKGDYLLFFDDDMLPESTVVERHVQHHNAVENSILVGNQLDNPELAKSDFQIYKAWLSRKWTSELASTKTQLKTPFITAAHFSIKKSTLESLEMFDDSLRDTEDFDLAVKALDNQISIFFDPTLMAWHDESLDCRRFINRQREYRRSAEELYRIRKAEAYKPRWVNFDPYKRAFFRVFSKPFLVRLIDGDSLKWLPRFFRFRLYSYVVTGLGSVYPNKKLE